MPDNTVNIVDRVRQARTDDVQAYIDKYEAWFIKEFTKVFGFKPVDYEIHHIQGNLMVPESVEFRFRNKYNHTALVMCVDESMRLYSKRSTAITGQRVQVYTPKDVVFA